MLFLARKIKDQVQTLSFPEGFEGPSKIPDGSKRPFRATFLTRLFFGAKGTTPGLNVDAADLPHMN